MKNAEKYKHPLYTYCENEKDADALAWAFIDKDNMVKFPFKFPELKEDELRVNVLYVGLCLSDVMSVRGHWGNYKYYPIVPGHEIIGEVSKLGSKVTNFKKGDLVGFGTRRYCCGNCSACIRGIDQACENFGDRQTYGTHWGGYATQMQQPSDHFFKLPDNFNLSLGAPLLCAGITTYNPIVKYTKKGTKTAVSGIGGLGHMAVKILHSMGYDVTGLTSSSDKIELIKSIGADSVINTANVEEIEKNKNSFDFILNTVPSDKVIKNLTTLAAPGGTIAQVGEGPATDLFNAPINLIVTKELKFIGSLVGRRDMIKEMLDYCSKNNIYPMVEEFKFEEFDKAFHRLEKERPKFRCVVNVKDFAEKNGWKK